MALTWLASTAAATPAQVVKLETRDGVTLEADLYVPAATGPRPGVVLLHMIPPHWERSSWPADFIAKLTSEKWSVCVVDRRGAGKSAGEPEEAYTGEKGRYDVEACVKALQPHGLSSLAVIGASNGTTSAIDYAAWAASQDLPVPAALGFMTGGGYTETNTSIAAVKAIPSIFTFSTDERDWSAKQAAVAPGWVLEEFPGGEHGTKMFAVKPRVAAVLLGFLKRHLA